MKAFTPVFSSTGRDAGGLPGDAAEQLPSSTREARAATGRPGRRVGSCFFLIGIGLLFILRGIQIQCLYPPLEGPDEYQHIAYLMFLSEQGKVPVYGKAFVPKALYPDLIDNPHCFHGWEQTNRIGGLRYKDFYERKPTLNVEPRIGLYQAQHPPVYYALCSKLFVRLKSAFSFRGAVYALRMLNIALGALALILLLLPLRDIFEDDSPFMSAALAVSLSPMFMIYVSRIANDPLAIVFAGIAVWQLLRIPARRRPALGVTFAGAALGIGMCTKLIVIGLIPAGLAYIVYLAMRSKMPRRTAFLCAAIIVALPLLIYAPVLAVNIRQFGVPFVSQADIVKAAKGIGMLDVLKQARFEHVWTIIYDVFIHDNLWFSGWSFLRPMSYFTQLYDFLLAVGFSGAILYAGRALITRKTPHGINGDALVLSLMVVLFTFGAVYGKMLSSIIAFGRTSASYYVMPAFPAFMTCCFAFTRSYGRTAAFTLAMAFAALFLATEYHSLLAKAVPHWAATDSISLIYERLTLVHPVFPTPRFFWPMALVCLLGTAGLAGVALRAFVRAE